MRYFNLIRNGVNKILDRTIGVFEMAVLGIIVISTLSYALAWQAPLGNPPTGNTDAPLNTGSTGQAKSGGLILNSGGAATGLIVQNGNVGIGTTSPARKLEIVASDDIARFTGPRSILDITNVAEDGIRLSTDGTGYFGIRTAATTGADQFIINTNGIIWTDAPISLGASSNTGENVIRGNLHLIGADQSGNPANCQIRPQNLSCAPGWANVNGGAGGKNLCVLCE